MELLTNRQQVILNLLIDVHIETASPVGSQQLTERFRLGYSPATIRHEMGALADRGYLDQPHSSAGRVPSDRGYRYYVDHCVNPAALLDTEWNQTMNQMGQDEHGGEDSFAEKTSRMLSALTEEMSVVVIPGKAKLFLQGSSYILDKPEFQNLKKIRTLFKAIEEKREFLRCLEQRPVNQNVVVAIGQENPSETFHDCSIVSTHYFSRVGEKAVIAILGPKRMRYSRIIPFVYRLANRVERMLDQRGDLDIL